MHLARYNAHMMPDIIVILAIHHSSYSYSSLDAVACLSMKMVLCYNIVIESIFRLYEVLYPLLYMCMHRPEFIEMRYESVKCERKLHSSYYKSPLSFFGFRQSALTSFWSLLRVRGIMHLVVEVEGVAVVEVTLEPTRRAMWKLLLPLKIEVTSLHWVASDASVVLVSHIQEANLTIIMEWKFHCKFLPFMWSSL